MWPSHYSERIMFGVAEIPDFKSMSTQVRFSTYFPRMAQYQYTLKSLHATFEISIFISFEKIILASFST